jgi:hypothetical protein
MATATKKKGKNPIGPVKKGALRKSEGLSTTKDMPEKDKVIKPGDSEHVRKMKQFALNAKKWKHKGSKSKKK